MAWHKQANETPLVINQENPLTETNSTEMSLSPEVRQTTKQTYTHQVRSRRRCKVRRGKKKNVRRQAKQIGNMIIIIIIKLTIAVPRPNRDGVERAFAFCSASNRSGKSQNKTKKIEVSTIRKEKKKPKFSKASVPLSLSLSLFSCKHNKEGN